MPQRPSRLLGLPDEGFSPWSCLDFDLAVLEYGESFEAALKATKEVAAPKARKRATVPAPKYEPADLRKMLGLPADLAPESDAAAFLADPVAAELGAALLRGDGADWFDFSDWTEPDV